MPPKKTTTKSAPDGKDAGGSLQPATSPAPSGTASAPGEAADDGSSAAAVGAAAAHTGDQGGEGPVTGASDAGQVIILPEGDGSDGVIEPVAQDRWLKVIGPQAGRWRAGRHFGPVARHVPMDCLSPEEISAIEGDPMLISSVVSNPDELD